MIFVFTFLSFSFLMMGWVSIGMQSLGTACFEGSGMVSENQAAGLIWMQLGLYRCHCNSLHLAYSISEYSYWHSETDHFY
jgi:hypothetical protein